MSLKIVLLIIFLLKFQSQLFSQIYTTENFNFEKFESESSNNLITDFKKPGINVNSKLNLKNINKFIAQEEAEKSFFVNATGGYLKEIEENYNTASVYQRYSLSKTFSKKFKLGLIVKVEYAKREELDFPDTSRWYDHTVLKASYSFNEFNTVSVFGGVSSSDQVFTSYGLAYSATLALEDFEINNELNLSNDYFYYWNEVAQNFVSDDIELVYKDFSFQTGIFYGVVDFNYVDNYEAKARNPNYNLNFQLQYQILSNPVTKIGIAYNIRDFKYRSPLYYSPSHRRVTGAYASLFEPFGKFYLYLGAGTSVDNESTFIWNVDSEIGYDYNNFSCSIGLGRYNDPFYTNYNTFLHLSKSF